MKDFIKEKFPKRINDSLKLKYVSLREIKTILKKLK